jgi:hypothetical protein
MMAYAATHEAIVPAGGDGVDAGNGITSSDYYDDDGLFMDKTG